MYTDSVFVSRKKSQLSIIIDASGAVDPMLGLFKITRLLGVLVEAWVSVDMRVVAKSVTAVKVRICWKLLESE